MAKPRLKRILFPLAALAAGFLALFLVLEIGLRFLPVSQGLSSMPVNQADPILRFKPDRTATWSKGWNFSIVNQVHINNDGFVNDHDYDPEAVSTLLAVIGDSYVEAVMVPFGQTLSGRLARRAADDGRVYSFASSGSPLSQYLAYAAYARDRYRPDGLVVVIVGNDFDESLMSEDAPAGYHYFRPDRSGGYRLVRKDLSYGTARRLLRKSSLLMYAVLNLKITSLPARLGQAGGEYAGNTRRQASAERVAEGERVTAEFLARLPEAAGLPPERIVLVLDGVRPDLYEPDRRAEGAESYWGVMRRTMSQRARAAGFEVLDMEPVFRRRFDSDGRRFEFESDGHWNGYAHGLVARELESSPVWSRVFGGAAAE